LRQLGGGTDRRQKHLRRWVQGLSVEGLWDTLVPTTDYPDEFTVTVSNVDKP
jgi:hypothetical protein